MLTGITVIDFTRYLSGSFCTMRLADMGAEVIKIESFPINDLRRSTNYQTVALNLKAPQGRELAFALAVQADVVIESFRPGVMRHLGMDYASLTEAKPDLVYCSLTGYGQTGPLHQLGGNDLNYQAVSGFLAVNHDRDGRPIVAELPIAEYAGGMYAAEQICAALVQKLRFGYGCHLDLNLVDVLSSWVGVGITESVANGTVSTRQQFTEPLLNYQVYETADGRFVALAAVEEQFWQNFCNAVGRPDWEVYAGESIFHQPEVYDELKALFLTRTQAEWHELGIEVDCCLTAVEEADQLTEGSFLHRRRREMYSRQQPISPQTLFGVETAETLRNKLNVSDTELRQYISQGIIPGWIEGRRTNE